MEQYGLRPGRSTELAGIRLIDNLTKQVDSGKRPITIFMELSEVFNIINHAIILLSMLNKLWHNVGGGEMICYGIIGQIDISILYITALNQ